MKVQLFDKKNKMYYEKDWYTPNTFCNNFKKIPSESGVYAIVNYPLTIDKEPEILYIGSSKCLINRYKNHILINKLKNKYEYIRFYFTTSEDYKNLEIKLIKLIKPQYNIQHNV